MRRTGGGEKGTPGGLCSLIDAARGTRADAANSADSSGGCGAVARVVWRCAATMRVGWLFATAVKRRRRSAQARFVLQVWTATVPRTARDDARACMHEGDGERGDPERGHAFGGVSLASRAASRLVQPEGRQAYSHVRILKCFGAGGWRCSRVSLAPDSVGSE
eukprot:354862-Chlamydomonas_euryale.AAC.1